MTLANNGVTVERFAPENLAWADLAALAELHNAVNAEEYPGDPAQPPEFYRALYRSHAELADSETFHWRARRGPSLVGHAEGQVRVGGDNAHVMYVAMAVDPAARRRGVARSLLGSVVQTARAADRGLLLGHVRGPEPLAELPGTRFVEAVGARPGLEDHIHRLRVPDVDVSMLQRWLEDGPRRLPEVELTWREGTFDEDERGPVARLFQVTRAGEPTDALDVEDFLFTAESVRSLERALEARGLRWTAAIARRRRTAELIGYTMVALDAYDERLVEQFGTGVDPDCRGHGVGRWLKAAMLLKVIQEHPERTELRTHTADSNAAMRAINLRLGFRPWVAECLWQAPVDAVEAFARAPG